MREPERSEGQWRGKTFWLLLRRLSKVTRRKGATRRAAWRIQRICTQPNPTKTSKDRSLRCSAFDSRKGETCRAPWRTQWICTQPNQNIKRSQPAAAPTFGSRRKPWQITRICTQLQINHLEPAHSQSHQECCAVQPPGQRHLNRPPPTHFHRPPMQPLTHQKAHDGRAPTVRRCL